MQLSPEAKQQSGRGQRLDQLGGDVAGIAEPGDALARWGANDGQHSPALAGERQRRGAADDAGADDRDIRLPRHSATVYVLERNGTCRTFKSSIPIRRVNPPAW